jgi:hypothetical protein
MKEHEIHVIFLKNNALQVIKYNKDWYNIYIDGVLKQYSDFNFYTELEFEKILNAKSIAFKKLDFEDLRIDLNIYVEN